jgi:hypothetical protein
MGLTGNFGALTLHGRELTVVGSSSGLPECELVARNVAVHQNGIVHQGPTNLELTSWKTDVPLAAAGFTADPALPAVALGCETYFNPENDGAVPTFVTFTWSQIVSITGG